jgi:hypothetical protein
VSAHRGDEASLRLTPLFRSLRERYDLAVRLKNSEGLSKTYNRYLNGELGAFAKFGPWETQPSANDIVVFLHDDVEMLGNNVETELNRWADEGFAILGLAGASELSEIKAPAVWQKIAKPGAFSGVSIFHNSYRDKDGTKQYNNPDQPFPAKFGDLKEVLLLDGLFLAVVRERTDPVGWRFDEDFDFHFYDLASTIKACSLGLRLRTVFIPVVHWSIGLSDPNDPVFRKNEAKFLAKFHWPPRYKGVV